MSKFNFKTDNDFRNVKEETEKFYKTIGEIYCPYFKEKIQFNSKGWRHLRFKSNRKARPRKDQYARFKLLYLAPEVLKQSHTLQGIWQTKGFEYQKVNKRWENLLKNITFYEFIAVLDNVRVKIIVKQIENGEKYFWSIIPFWRVEKTTGRRILYSNINYD